MKKWILIIFLLAISLGVSSQGALIAGVKAPLFKGKTDNNTVWKLADLIGQKNVVLYFYPAAMTGGCTKQACSYRDHLPDFEKYDAVVVGISGDDVASLKAFRKAETLNFTLLSDQNGEIAKKYGVPVKEGGSIKRTIDNMEIVLNRGVTAGRWTFIIGKDSLIKYVNSEVDAANDYKAVLDILSGR